MDRAINKSTGDSIKSLEVYKNGSYQNLKKGEWIAPKYSISNIDELENKEIPVHYVSEKEYKNYKGTEVWCSPCFAIYPGTGAITVAESPTHKLLKNWMFNRIKNDDLQIRFATGVKPHKYENKYKLSELDINWNDFEIEVTTKGTRKMRADILLPFNNKHILLGEGIIFEIQLSSQNRSKTSERTIGRALHGYSVCWLFKKDFDIEDDMINLKNNIIDVNSFSEQMHFAKKGFVGKLKNVVEDQCRYLDEKIKESNIKSENVLTDINNLFYDIEGELSLIKNKSLKEIDNKKDELIKDIIKIEDNPFEVIVEKYKKDINGHLKIISNKINNIVVDAIDHINTVAINRKKEIDETYPRVIKCKKCGGTMIFKITPLKEKELYECQSPACNNIIWVK